MAIAKRGKTFHIRFRPFGEDVIGLKTPARSKTEAKHLEMAILTACRSGDFRALDPVSREACVRMFRNQGWQIPPGLGPTEQVTEELTLWKSMELFLRYPEIRNSTERERYEQCLVHLADHFGKDHPVKSIWVPEIKEYIAQRREAGAASSTINREKGTLSKLFQVLVELRRVDANPVRLVKNLSQKSEEREVYISFADFTKMTDEMTSWFEPIARTAFYAGMRRGEILSLTRSQVRLGERMLLLGPKDTKEGHWKRVPIHRDLMPTLENVLRIQALGSDKVFLIGGKPPHRSSWKKPWAKAVKVLSMEPRPRFHDLRHTWKTNARRSGMDPEIREAIMGHWYRGRNVNERYCRIGDAELIRAIDSMTFDHGRTEILVAKR